MRLEDMQLCMDSDALTAQMTLPPVLHPAAAPQRGVTQLEDVLLYMDTEAGPGELVAAADIARAACGHSECASSGRAVRRLQLLGSNWLRYPQPQPSPARAMECVTGGEPVATAAAPWPATAAQQGAAFLHG